MANKFDHDIWIVDTLAQGPSYWSHVAYWPEEDQKVLLKHVNPNCTAEEKIKIEERLLKEASILEEFWSVYFPKVFDIRRRKEDEKLYILSEFFSGETLDHFIEKNPKKALTAKFYLHLYSELKFALSYLHGKKKIIHFDLTPDNIIVDLELGIHIIDFENSRILGSSLSSSEVRGKEGFLPPEITSDKNVRESNKNIFATAAIDTYALGKILDTLYEQLPPLEKFKLIGKGPNLKSLIHPNPGMRKIEGQTLSVPPINAKPFITILFFLMTAFMIKKVDFTSENPPVVKTRELKKDVSRSPALPRYSKNSLKRSLTKKRDTVKSSLKKTNSSDEVSLKQSSIKKTAVKKPLSFQEKFLKTIGKRDPDLQECLQTFTPISVKKVKLRYHIVAGRNKLEKLEVLAPNNLSLNAKICLTSLYKDLDFPAHQSQKSYTIDQSFTFSKVE